MKKDRIVENARLAALMPQVESALKAMITVCDVHAFRGLAQELSALLAKIKGA